MALSASSTIQLTSPGSGGTLTFSSASRTRGTLTINGWTGMSGPLEAGSGGKIFILSLPPADFPNNVHFTGFAAGADWNTTSNELVPASVVPEPRDFALAAGLGLLIFACCRRLAKPV